MQKQAQFSDPLLWDKYWKTTNQILANPLKSSTTIYFMVVLILITFSWLSFQMSHKSNIHNTSFSLFRESLNIYENTTKNGYTHTNIINTFWNKHINRRTGQQYLLEKEGTFKQKRHLKIQVYNVVVMQMLYTIQNLLNEGRSLLFTQGLFFRNIFKQFATCNSEKSIIFINSTQIKQWLFNLIMWESPKHMFTHISQCI